MLKGLLFSVTFKTKVNYKTSIGTYISLVGSASSNNRVNNVVFMKNNKDGEKKYFSTFNNTNTTTTGILTTEVIKIGQPTPESHPHLLKAGEITKGITIQEYKDRRNKFLRIFPVGSTVILHSPPETMMSYDIPWDFRQNTNFLYLTGFQEPESILMLEKVSESMNKSTMFVRPKVLEREIWDGPRCGPNNIKELFGVDHGEDINNFTLKFNNLLKEKEIENNLKKQSSSTTTTTNSLIYINKPENWRDLFNKSKSLTNNLEYQEIENYIQMFRLTKSKSEISMMLESGTIAGDSFSEVMKYIKPGMNECEISAYFEYQIKKRGAKRMSYPPVVASGNSGNTLHYISNNNICKDGDLLLMDAGCEYWGYTSDITRTFPVNGKFTEAQKIIYEAVLDVNQKCIQLCQPGQSISSIHRKSVELTREHLLRIGIIQNNLKKESSIGKSTVAAAATVDKYYPHSIGHYLGMDTHDCLSFDYGIELEPGMIITIEPGIYISKDDLSVPPEFRGIAIRIEDDVAITDSEPLVLTKAAPKLINHIEEIMSSQSNNNNNNKKMF